MIAEIINSIELSFWNLIITLLTKSSLLRTIVRSTYLASQDKGMMRKIAIVLLVFCVGFASGLLIYSVTLLVICLLIHRLGWFWLYLSY